jgi:hypothetical protein
MTSGAPYPHMPEETIVCVDCGGPARLLSTWDDDNPPQPGDLAVYRCVECLDRWDLLIPGADGDPDPTGPT